MYTRPRKFCLVGSTRFKTQYEQVNRDLTLKGHIVLTVGMYGHQEGLSQDGPVKEMLDRLHLSKIDEADDVFVINPKILCCERCRGPYFNWLTRSQRNCNCPAEGALLPYIGASTTREIQYALRRAKTMHYLEPDDRLFGPDLVVDLFDRLVKEHRNLLALSNQMQDLGSCDKALAEMRRLILVQLYDQVPKVSALPQSAVTHSLPASCG